MRQESSIQSGLELVENDPSKTLGLHYGAQSLKPDEYIPKAECQTIPEISFPVAIGGGTYLLVALDLDAPFQSFSVLGPILHCIRPGFKASSHSTSTNSTTTQVENQLTSTSPYIAEWLAPAPPPGSGPHRYMFFLYDQPADFNAEKYMPDGKPVGMAARMRYDLDGFVKEAGLGEPVAVNYFTSN